MGRDLERAEHILSGPDLRHEINRCPNGRQALVASCRVAPPALLPGLMVAKGGGSPQPAPVITLARAATQKEALNTQPYNEGKKLVCKFCRQYAVNNSAQKGARRCPARSNAPAASNLLGTMRGNSNRGHT